MRNLILVSFCTISFLSISQNEEDALRYSENFVNGSAKNIAMGGSISALGADYSATSQNPAGMARFSKNNFIFTPIVEYNKNTSDFYSNKYTANSATLKIGNVSYLKSYLLPKDKYNGWQTLQLGAGYKRINSFDNKLHYIGEIDSSILHNFINDANGTNPDFIYQNFPLGAGLAYDVYAIDPDTNSSFNSQNIYTTLLKGNTTHNRLIKNKGGINEFSFAMSGNYENKIYLGGTININNISYESEFSHKENFALANSIWLNNIEYTGILTTKGYGVNAKIGAIFLPTDKIRIGTAIHTPTYYKLNDKWSNNMKSNTDDPAFPDKFIKDEFVPKREFDYKLKTPLKANFSLAYIIKKQAAITAEIEYINYSSSNLKSPQFSDAPYSFSIENKQIRNIYKQSFNFKLGAEYRINPMLYLRGGTAFYQKPVTNASGINTSSTLIASGGFGLNFGEYYVDVAVSNKSNSFDYYAYNPDLKGSLAKFKTNKTTFAVSIGYRFH